VDRAVLCVYLDPTGGLNRAVWQLEARAGTRFDCVFAIGVEGQILHPPAGERLTAALKRLPGFDAAVFVAAAAAVTTSTAGRFVCWDRLRGTTSDAAPSYVHVPDNH